MKRKILLTLLVLTSVYSFGQSAESENYNKPNQQNGITPVTYKLFSTTNRWTFLKLNTRNGMMWQVQYHTDGDSRFETFLNLLPLVNKEKETDNRFTLYPTQNIWTFILFDQIDGKSWQVQWSQEPENRGIWSIE
jgi:hypothetical protein